MTGPLAAWPVDARYATSATRASAKREMREMRLAMVLDGTAGSVVVVSREGVDALAPADTSACMPSDTSIQTAGHNGDKVTRPPRCATSTPSDKHAALRPTGPVRRVSIPSLYKN